MRLRSIMATVACFIVMAPAHGAQTPYRVSLIGDGYDGTAWHTGVLIELDDGWKTYWRMPGEAGIPPEFTWKSSVPADIVVLFPVPGRFRDASGETVGYENAVVFPVTVNAGAATGVKLDLGIFFAVCKDVCIPAQATARIELGSAILDPSGSAQVAKAEASLPVPGTIATSASVELDGTRPTLVLALENKPDDIFVETSSSAYFRAPQFSNGGREARLIIDNVPDIAKLKGVQVSLTAAIGGRGVEQTLTLP